MSEVLSFVRRSRCVDVEGEWGGTWINGKKKKSEFPSQIANVTFKIKGQISSISCIYSK